MTTFHGTAGDDNFTGHNNDDFFDLGQGGHDTADGGKGDDIFDMAAALDAGDSLTGGIGNDIVQISGNYTHSHSLHIGAGMFSGIETLELEFGNSCDVTFAANAIDQDIFIDAGFLKGANHLTLTTAGTHNFDVFAGSGDDVLTGGTSAVGSNTFDLSRGGEDTVDGTTSDVTVLIGAELDAGDRLTNVNTIFLDGDYIGAHRLVMSNKVVSHGTSNYILGAGHSYDIKMNDANTDGANIYMSAAEVGAGNTFAFDGRAENDGSYQLELGTENDRVVGSQNGDTIDMLFGGDDRIDGQGGDDTIDGRSNVTSADRVDGGSGNDTLALHDNTYDLTLTRNFVSIETLLLSGGTSIVLKSVDANVAAGKTMTVDASGMLAGGESDFDGGAETNGKFHFLGGAGENLFVGGTGDDVVTGGTGNMTIDLSKGGDDTVHGGSGIAVVNIGGALTADDRFDGVQQVTLDGNYAGTHALTLAPATFVDVAIFKMLGKHDYDITLNDANVGNSAATIFDGFQVDKRHGVTIDGSAETGGTLKLFGSQGDDVLTGGGGDDFFVLKSGGHDHAFGGGGSDEILAKYDSKSHYDGGAGDDTLTLDSDGGPTNVHLADNLTGIETLAFENALYNVIAIDANVGAGKTLTVDATSMGSTAGLSFDGSREKGGAFHMIGGDGFDTLVGGDQDDVLDGGAAGDYLKGGKGDNTYLYHGAAESSSVNYDSILSFDLAHDRFDLDCTVTKVDHFIAGGSLDQATFDDDMHFAMSGNLLRHHAILYEPSAGDYVGFLFLVVDANGTAGYQANEDYLFNVESTAFESADKDIFI